jgi:hypothetical protein
MKIRHIFLVLSIQAFSLSVVGAQDDPVDNTVSIVFKTMSVGSGSYDDIYVQSSVDAEPTLLTFNRYNRSKLVTYKGTLPIVFFRLKPNPIQESPPIRIPVARFNMNPDKPIKDLLLFIFKNPKSGSNNAEFILYGMDDSKKAFPNNSIVIFNASGIKLHGVIHKEHAEFDLGASKPFKLSKSVYAAFAVKIEDSIRYVYENTLGFSEDTRVIIMVRPPARERSIRFECYQITEFTGAEIPESTPTPTEENAVSSQSNSPLSR